MQALTNPYTPHAGAEPQAVVGRDDQLASFDLPLSRIERKHTEQSMIITGLRGVGKTVLLGQFQTKALERQWVVIELQVSKHHDNEFRRDISTRLRSALLELSPRVRWTQRFRHAAAVLKSFTLSTDAAGTIPAGLDIEAAEGFAEHAHLAMDLTDVLIALGEAALELGRGVVLLFDEIQFLSRTQLESLSQAIHKKVQRKLPITMVGAGLPHIAALAGDAKSSAERLFKFLDVGYLPGAGAREAFSRPAGQENASCTTMALGEAVRITGGYPHFIQELGHASWMVAAGPVITAADVLCVVPTYQAKLDTSFFRVGLDRSTELQRAYRRAMAELMGRQSTNAGRVDQYGIALHIRAWVRRLHHAAFRSVHQARPAGSGGTAPADQTAG